MKLVPFDIDKFTEDLPVITSSKIKDGNKISKDGLFSQQIFGPTNSYKCGCKKTYFRGPSTEEKVCKTCGVEITTSDIRDERYAKLELPFYVLSPLAYNILIKYSSSMKVIINGFLNYRHKYYLDEKNNLKIATDEIINDDSKIILEGLDGLEIYISNLCETSNKRELKYLENNFEIFKIKHIIVIPPTFRTLSSKINGVDVMDSLNRYYKDLLKRIEFLNAMKIDLDENMDIYKYYFKIIQTCIINLSDYIIGRISGKNGLIRKNILGKRLDFSSRAVICPDPSLKLNECKLPYFLLLELLKPQFTVFLINKKIEKKTNKVVKMIETCIIKKDYKLFDLLEEFVEGKICLLNRQPTLHRVSMLSFNMKAHKGNTIMIHPMITTPLNADFDGDAIAAYIPLTEESEHDMIHKTSIKTNLINPTNSLISAQPNQDIILGIYHITK